MSIDQGAIPQGLIEQSRAKEVDPGYLQMLGKQAAALYSEGTPLTDAVVKVASSEQLGPEHIRRVCEFANQAAYKNEWEKGGSIRNIEFENGPADPPSVLRELYDGSHDLTNKTVSDYDSPPAKLACEHVEDQIFGKYASANYQHPQDIPSGMEDLADMHSKLMGAAEHFKNDINSLSMQKEAAAHLLVDSVSDTILSGHSMAKIASAWSSSVMADAPEYKEAIGRSLQRCKQRNIPLDNEKLASGYLPNREHPVIQHFTEFAKVGRQLRLYNGANKILQEKLASVRQALKSLH